MERTVLCLCHDVTASDLEDAYARGFTAPETIKRYTAAFMGPCQGKSCADLILNEIVRLTGSTEPQSVTQRPPAYPVRLGELAGLAAPDDARAHRSGPESETGSR
jgi:bacterioferritin-associated ferredoxin